MTELNHRTRGNGSPQGKPRVYFTCHPADFATCFDRICRDIFTTHDCAVYYTEDMEAEFVQEDAELLLECNNLFVVPVTLRLLTDPNRAMDFDIQLAKRRNIPILPILMETGIDEVYARADKFGELQYISPCTGDETQISYEEKLKKHLEMVLISDEMAHRVRGAFDAYIFLSYRKKDRRYANELMRLIHDKKEFRGIAVWYDEFLTPGESFRENIDRILRSSKLFALLVTPNLLEEPGGRPNFVMGTEYPMAREAGMEILPAEMVSTDKTVLADKYRGIPDCIDPYNSAGLDDHLQKALRNAAVRADCGDPVHNFLIGLAYLEGIDVELDRKRGLGLVTLAAEAELPEAMERLYEMYLYGHDVAMDYRKAAYWAEKLVAYNTLHLGEEAPRTLDALHNLAAVLGDLGEYRKAVEKIEKAYALSCRVLGETHPKTLISLGNLAVAYGRLGEYDYSLELGEKGYALNCRIHGETSPEAMIALSNLGSGYAEAGYHEKAVDLLQTAYDLRCQILGEEHPGTLVSLHNLASSWGLLGEKEKALELAQKVYDLGCSVLGEEHPKTLSFLNLLATSFQQCGQLETALKWKEKACEQHRRTQGESHPDTILALNNLASAYVYLGRVEKALPLLEKAFSLCCRVMGQNHPETRKIRENLAASCFALGHYGRALPLLEASYEEICEQDALSCSETRMALKKLFAVCFYQRDYEKARIYQKKQYELCRKQMGEGHPETLEAMEQLAAAYHGLDRSREAREILKQAYDLCMRYLGLHHTITVHVREDLERLGGFADGEPAAPEEKRCRPCRQEAPGAGESNGNCPECNGGCFMGNC